MSDVQPLTIPEIKLEWVDWATWTDLQRSTANVYGKETGVYEVKYRDLDDSAPRLHIGRAGNKQSLQSRIRAMVKGENGHSTGKRICVQENIANLVVRWARTDRPAAAEEELHRLHKQKHGNLPKYDQHT